MKNSQNTILNLRDFLDSKNGKHLLIGVLCIVIFGIIFTLWMRGSQEASVLRLHFARSLAGGNSAVFSLLLSCSFRA